MNENRIGEVIEVEKRAQEMVARATHEAEQLPIEAEARAVAIAEGARAAAQDQAARIIQEATQAADSSQIISHTEENMSRIARLADKNLEKAISYVLERVLGRP